MTAITERLYEAICRHPGETMAVLAQSLGTTIRALWRPSTRLRKEGRVRSVGRQKATRYFPMGA